MLPGFTVADMSNGAGVHSEASRYRAGGFAAGNIGTDLANHFFRKLGLRTCAAASLRPEIRDGADDAAPPFSGHVVVIGLHRAERQMARVDANRVVARVHNNNRLPFGQRASVMQFISVSVRKHFPLSLVVVDKAVAHAILVSKPWPTFVRRATMKLLSEPNFGRCALASHASDMGNVMFQFKGVC